MNHPRINKIDESLNELLHKGYEKQINHELNLIFYELFHDLLARISSLQPQAIIENLLRFYKHLLEVVELLTELLQSWEVGYLREDKTLKRVVLNILHNEISNQHVVEEVITEGVLKWMEDFREDKPNPNGELLTKMTLDIGMFRKSI